MHAAFQPIWPLLLRVAAPKQSRSSSALGCTFLSMHFFSAPGGLSGDTLPLSQGNRGQNVTKTWFNDGETEVWRDVLKILQVYGEAGLESLIVL